MGSARKILIEILKESPTHQSTLAEVSKTLYRSRTLGFGVEPKDVIYALKKEGRICYDWEKEIVSLVPQAVLEITEEMKKKWDESARAWAAELKKKLEPYGGRDAPIYDPDMDENHDYTFKPFK